MQANTSTRPVHATHNGKPCTMLPGGRNVAMFGVQRVNVRYADGTTATLHKKHLRFT